MKLRMKPPVKLVTPYGGRLVGARPCWADTWPGLDSSRGDQDNLPFEGQGQDQTQEEVALCKSQLARWSQIMYMYYFLGHQLMDNPNLTDAQKEVGD